MFFKSINGTQNTSSSTILLIEEPKVQRGHIAKETKVESTPVCETESKASSTEVRGPPKSEGYDIKPRQFSNLL